MTSPDPAVTDPDEPVPPPTRPALVLGAVAVGGGAGAAARAGVAELLPHPADGFDLATLTTNVLGSFLLGVLMVVVVEHRRGHPLLRPFAGVGVLGGFTTFSTYAVHARGLLADRPLPALAELALGVAMCLAAVGAGITLARRRGRP